MKLTNGQKWGIGGMVGAVGAAVVFGFAIAKKIPPEVVYSVFGIVILVMGYLGFKVTSLPVPPEETPDEPSQPEG